MTVLLCAVFAPVFVVEKRSELTDQNRTMKNKMNKMIGVYIANKELVSYLFFGICTTVINTFCYWLLCEVFAQDNIVSTTIAWLVAVAVAFITNRVYVFESQSTHVSECIKQLVFFFGCRILTGFLDVLIMAIAVDLLKWNGLLWKLISNVIVTIINYIASKYLIFKNKK